MRRIATMLLLLAATRGLAQPAISLITPVKGVPGSSVFLAGANFNATPANDVVYFGATRATVTSSGTTTMTVTVPAGATYDLVTVMNSATSLSGSSKYPFLPTYDNSPYLPDTVNFDPQVKFATGLFPKDVKIADIDRDGKPDVVVTNEFDHSISVYRNISTTGSITLGSFAPQVTFGAGTNLYSLTIGDVDGDGRLDLIVVNQTDLTISVLHNTSSIGAISFDPQIVYATRRNPSSVAIGDLDGDGKPDLVVADDFSDTISVYKNSSVVGSPSFLPQVLFEVHYQPHRVAIADMDGDGKPDVVVTTQSGAGELAIMHNESSGGAIILSTGFFFPGASIDNGALCIADIDGDGKLDVVVANESSNNFSAYLNNSLPGSPSLATMVIFSGTFNDPSGIDHAAMGDVDGDGKPDLIYTDVNFNFVAIARNKCTTGVVSFSAFSGVATGRSPLGVALGDLDGDGKPELVVANFADTTVSIIKNEPLPDAITGYPGVCLAGTTTLHYNFTGGTWSSSNAGIASVGSTTGIVTGVSVGTATITYSLGVTTVTATVTVSATVNAGTITGNTPICLGASLSLSDAAPGGLWSLSPAIATIGSTTGILLSTSGGTATVSYTVINGCGTARATTVVTVVGSPAVGTVTGTATVCAGSTTSLSDAVIGGTWSSGAGGIATVGSTGVVTGVSAGTARISYTVNNGCSSLSATKVVTVNITDPGTISGTATVFAGGTTTLTDPVAGGFWSSVSGNVTVGGTTGVVTGVSAGTAIISYTRSGTCGSASATIVVTVMPVSTVTISGNVPLCLGSTITLTGSPVGGTWSSDNLAIDTVSIDSGIVRGIAAGTADITYTVGGVSTSVVTTVNGISRPTVGCEAGSGICGFANVELLSGVTVNYIAGVTNGTTEIYPVFPTTPLALAVGTFSYAPTVVDVSYLAGGYTSPTWSVFHVQLLSVSYAGCTWSSTTCGAGLEGISGNVPICSGGTQTLTVTPPGGTWSSGNPGVATIGSATGVVTGIGAGTALITYNMGTVTYPLQQIVVVTVNASTATAGTITGTGNVCTGGTTSLTDATTGGVWSSGAPGVATVGSTGLVTGVSTGTATISYTVTGSCGSASATIVVTVSEGSAGTITGSTIICIAGTAALTDAVAGGTWTSGAPGVATVNTSGVVTGVSLGTATISYITGGSCGGTATLIVTVSTSVTAGTITGIATVCTGSTTSLTDAVGGGSWSSSNTLIASVGSTGVVVGVATGTAIIYYTVSNSCGTVSANRVVTVNPSPTAGTITGTAVLCSTGTTTLSDAAAGGTWSSVTPAVATIGSTGIVTGVSAGTTVISYSVTNSCGTTAAATRVVTVNGAPNAGTITGTTTVCGGATTALTDAVTGGVWSSGTPAVATVNATGLVTGVSFGTTTISYTVTNSCGTATATTVVNVSGSSAGTITGPATVLTGSSISLTDAVSGGSWTASNGNATVSATGLVTGVAVGTVAISYTVVSGCGALTATKIISVGHVASLPAISGYFFYMCTGATAAFWDATTGGTWDISPTTVATISATGVATGMSAGTATISYTYGGSTVTAVVTVYATPAAITGATSICVGTTTTLTDATPGGTWSSAAVTVATISTAGLVTGAMAGTTTIYYTGAAGCKASTILTVTSGPSGIAGATSVCAGSSISLSDFTAGGTWSSSGSISVAATGSTTAMATGISAGAATVTYSLGGSCYRTFGVTVKPLPSSILGNLSVCGIGSVTFLSDVTSGISWTIAPVAVATVSPSGRVYGVSAGTANVTYTATNACITTAVVSVNVAPVVAPITGPTNVSHGAMISLADATTGGNWSSSNSAMASVDAAGTVTGVGTTGTAIISYSVSYPTAGSCSAVATKSIAVHTPAPHVHGATTIVGATVNMADETVGGEWTSSDNGIATVDGNGIITAIAAGNVNITHTTGAITTTTHLLVNPLPFEVRMVPNPNKGTFTISGTVGTNKDETVSIEITNMLGQMVYNNSAIAQGGIIQQTVLLNTNLANGMYLLNVKSGGESKTLHFVMEK